MNILCPNCQRPLTVQEHYAGQKMKCPLCGGTFDVPALAAAPGSPPPASPSPPPFAEDWPPPSTSATPTQPTETYGLSGQHPTPERSQAPERQHAPPPSPEPPPGYEERAWELPEPEPSSQGLEVAPPSPPPPEGYTRRFSLSINPRALPWIAPGAFVLIFFLTFFNWVGLYPGGYAVYTQNGWQAAFGGYSSDDEWEANVREKEPGKDGPGFGWLTFFYLLIFFPTLFLAIASVLIHLKFLPLRLPPPLQQYWQLRPLAVAGIALFAFFFLGLQVLFGFKLDSEVQEEAEAAVKQKADSAKTEKERHIVDLREAAFVSALNPRRTFVFRLVVILHLLAIAGLGLEYWLDRRGHRPAPRLDVMW
jgi:hypothetical protein